MKMGKATNPHAGLELSENDTAAQTSYPRVHQRDRRAFSHAFLH